MATVINNREGSKLAELVSDDKLEITLGQGGVTVDVIRGLRRLREANEDADDETIGKDKCMRAATDWIATMPD